MLRKPTILVVAVLSLLGGQAVAPTGPTEAQAKTTIVRPVLPPASIPEAKQPRWCHFRQPDNYQAEAACVIRVTWQGDWRTGREAVRTGWCESGLNRTRGVPGATYWGVWQFDASARRTYGWGYTLIEQVGATYRIHKARGWQPFPDCKPGGTKHGPSWSRAPRDVKLYG